MSIAVAVRTRGKIVLATDSKRTFGGGAVPEATLSESKIRKVASSYLASTGWGVYANIFDDYFASKKRVRLTDQQTIFRFFQRFWRDLHDRYAFVNDQCSEDDSPFADLDSSFLITSPRGIFSVACDMSVTAFEQYYAIGSGEPYALGALHALYDARKDAEKIAIAAVEAACAMDIYCGGKVNTRALRASGRR